MGRPESRVSTPEGTEPSGWMMVLSDPGLRWLHTPIHWRGIGLRLHPLEVCDLGVSVEAVSPGELIPVSPDLLQHFISHRIPPPESQGARIFPGT